MKDHDCVWRTSIEWCDDTEATAWLISAAYRVRCCQICGACQRQQPKGLRHRQRTVVRTATQPPKTLLSLLSPERFKPFSLLLTAAQKNRLEMNRQLEEWLEDGWIEVEEKQDYASRAWEIERVRLSRAATALLIDEPRKRGDQTAQQLQESSLASLIGWRGDYERAVNLWHSNPETLALLSRLGDLLQTQEGALRANQWVPFPGSNLRAGDAPHRRWLSVFRGLLAFLTHEQWEYERTFSARWLNDSKQLAHDRQGLEDYLGVRFETLGLFRHTPVVYCWGDFEAQYEGIGIDGRAGSPFVALAAETIYALQQLKVRANRLLVIENQTAFETLLHPPLRQDDCLYLFSSGHAGQAEREQVRRWFQVAPGLHWYLWTDWDFGGVRIQQDWSHWAVEHNLPAPIAWMWDDAALERWRAWGQPLTDHQQTQLAALEHPLARRLLRFGYSLEQETVLSDLAAGDFAGE